MSDYELIDSGDGRKLERFGDYLLDRPAAQAAWRPRLGASAWGRADASFDRSEGNRWRNRSALPDRWEAEIEGLRFSLAATDFGHVGVFPEQGDLWNWIRGAAGAGPSPSNVLNLFAYSGGATLAAAAAGAEVCHLDASKGMVDRARKNASLSGLGEAPIRWIVDDAIKFLKREDRRGKRYDGVILDPPSFGRGKKGEVFKIQNHMTDLLDLCRAVLAPHPRFFLLTSHTPEFSPTVLGHLVTQLLGGAPGDVETGEMLLRGGPGVLPLPSGAYARWAAGAGKRS